MIISNRLLNLSVQADSSGISFFGDGGMGVSVSRKYINKCILISNMRSKYKLRQQTTWSYRLVNDWLPNEWYSFQDPNVFFYDMS